MLAFQKESQAGHLSDAGLRRLRELLTAEMHLQSAQHAQHDAAARQLRDLTDTDSVLERELAEVGAQRAREALAEIDDALERLEAGTFGRCESCGAPVPFERLEVVPSARFCVACAGRRAGLR